LYKNRKIVKIENAKSNHYCIIYIVDNVTQQNMNKRANEMYQDSYWGTSTQDDWGNSYHEYNNQ